MLLENWLEYKPFVKAVEETWQFIFASLNSQLDFAVRFSAACCLKQVLYDYGNDISELTFSHRTQGGVVRV